MADLCQLSFSKQQHASPGGNAVKPVLFEPMIMSMLLSLKVQVQNLQKQLDDLKHQRGP